MQERTWPISRYLDLSYTSTRKMMLKLNPKMVSKTNKQPVFILAKFGVSIKVFKVTHCVSGCRALGDSSRVCVDKFFSNLLMIHQAETKEIITMTEFLYVVSVLIEKISNTSDLF